jgi:beta-lactamase superfamily II metal-dependent hydrolase
MEGKKLSWLIGGLSVGVICALILFWQVAIISDNREKIVFLNIGQGDAALIKFDSGEKMLVDCGLNRKILSKLGKYLSFFDRTIDYLLVTHPDGDHYGGCSDILRRYKIKTIIFGDFKKSNDPYWRAWTKYSQAENAQWKFIDGHEVMMIGNTRLEFFSPDHDLVIKKDATLANNHSIVFKLSNHLGNFLFTGDMEMPLEEALLNKYCPSSAPCLALAADYLKIGHHGSESSSGKDFLQAVLPRYAVISVGPNKYGHPSSRVLHKLERLKAAVWRTDQKDDIIIK